ncbi:virulence RhuM family protein [Desulfobotulus mexicanus]|uniref:Virulence RhuM family protein n=1 Tax=Desulfobotulus mexicanus TaxID=2586642 RepID=A0A5S5MDR8_9BACT|nr:virulence RhuM family protein [Desulfobotulus mexicanus]TYT73853.1 virulence RhuM family protein [Desulfobotulus mexicanus]
MEQNSEIIIYTASDGTTKLQVQLENETVWLTQDQMAMLFGKAKSTINEHIKNIYAEGELAENQTLKKFGISEFQQKTPNHYNLDIIISVGYRVKSIQGTKFRQWATKRIHEYIVKGFTMDDDRLKQEGARSRYFEELLQRIRDIRSSERNFYQKVTDIYATSIDYKNDATLTKEFFATVQNKMHYAVHGQTAAEMISQRVNAEKPFLGLTNFHGKYITTRDISIAKNYLSEDELKQLNLIVSMYLDFAELQATNGRLMKMNDWIQKLDDFLRISEKELLTNAGKVSHKKAVEKAKIEYEKYRKEEDKKYISDFDREMKKLLKDKKKT